MSKMSRALAIRRLIQNELIMVFKRTLHDSPSRSRLVSAAKYYERASD